MRVVLVTPGFSAGDGDWCIPALAHLVRRLAAAHDVEVVTLRYPPRGGEYRAFGARVHALGGGTARGPARLLLLVRALRHLAGRLRRRPAAVVHALWADEPGWLAVTAARRAGVPAVVSLLGGELVGDRALGYGVQLSPLGRRLVRTALRRADLVTVGSAFLAERAAAQVPAGRLRRWPLGVDTALFAPAAHPTAGGGPALLHVAALSPVKDQATLLRAFALFTRDHPGARLEIAGAGPLLGNLTALAGELGVEARVRFLGAVPHHELPAVYARAELCLLSSRFESQGMVVLEAAACGRATVGPAVGVLPELLPHCAAVLPGDAEGLAAALRAALDGPGPAVLGEASRAAAEARFSLAGAVAAVEALWAEAAR